MRIGIRQIFFNDLCNYGANILKNVCDHRVLVWVEMDGVRWIWQALSMIYSSNTSFFDKVRMSGGGCFMAL
jgi:hypothetical protein